MQNKMVKEPNLEEIAARIKQIKYELFDGSNKRMSDKTEIDKTNLSAIINSGKKFGWVVIQNLIFNIDDLSADWLLKGKGTMLIGEQNANGNANQQVSGTNNSVSYNNKEAIDTLSRQIEEKDRQINLLLKTLENLTSK